MAVGGGPRAGERGQATVELVLALPVVVALLLLVIQVAVVVRTQVLVVDAAREGARAAAIGGPAAAAPAARATPGLAPGRLEVSVAGGEAPGQAVVVTVRYRAATDVALVGPLVGEPVLTATVAMRTEGSSATDGGDAPTP